MPPTDQTPTGLLAIVLTCKSSPAARVDSALSALASLDIPLDIEVVEGFVSEDAQIDLLYDAKSNRRWVKRPISRAEVAVYATHRLAWERLRNSERQAALIFEDDFSIHDSQTVASVIRSWKEILGNGRDIVKLFDFEKRGKNSAAFAVQVNGVNLAKWTSPTAGMVAYLISREGAAKFLSRDRIFRQVDEDTKYFWEVGLNIWSVPGNPVHEISHKLGGSLVEAERQRNRKRRLGRSLWGNVLTISRKARTRLHLLLERFKQEQ